MSTEDQDQAAAQDQTPPPAPLAMAKDEPAGTTELVAVLEHPARAAFRRLHEKLNSLGSYVLASTEAERAELEALLP